MAVCLEYVRVTQPVEHLTFNQGVGGSSPLANTINIASLTKRLVTEAPYVGIV